MKEEQASGTALLIAASLILLNRNPKYSRVVSKNSAAFAARLLEEHSPATRWFLKNCRHKWFRSIAKVIERMTIPGVLLHYALRKKCIAQIARNALNDGFTQIVIFGAGFDPLSLELQTEFPQARLWEIDHPATQRYKRRAFPHADDKSLHFVPLDLSVGEIDKDALIAAGLD